MTRIEIQTPSEVGETARVLQLANQRRLADRQADGWAEREAQRLAERARSFVGSSASRAAKDDPWRGAVPEFDPPPEVRARIPGKRFKVAGAYFQWRRDGAPPVSTGRLLIWTASKEHSAVINLPYAPRWYEALPAGGDRVVLLFYGYSMNVQYTPQQIETDTGWLPGAPNITSGGGGILWHTGTLRNRTITTESWTTATASLADYRIAVVVRKDEISHKLSWPDSLRQVVEQKYECAKSIRKTTSPTNVGVTRYEYGQSITNTYTYKATGGSVPNDVFAAGTGEIVETMPQYDPGGAYNPYGGGLWVPVDSLPGGTGNQLYFYRYPPHPAVDSATMNTLGQTVNYTPSTIQINTTESSTHQNEDYEVVFTPNAYQVPTLLQFSTPGGPDIVGIYVWHPLMRSYGYGYLVNRDAAGQTPGWGRTPAVFSFLKNYTGEFHKEDGDTSMLTKASSYQHARDNYIPQDAPPYFLTTNVAIPEATVDTTKTYYYFRAPAYDIPLDYSNPLTFRTEGNTIVPTILRPNRGEYTSEVFQSSLPETQKHIETGGLWFVSEYEIPVAAWDWDRPLACWLELTRLGFTNDDLMLSDDEAKALAEADPAKTAFKF
jgi:hypothetical protein